MNPKILPNYIRTQLRQGVQKERLIETLRVGGWNPADIEIALKEAEKTPDTVPSFQLSSAAQTHPHIVRRIILVILLLLVAGLAYLYYIGGEGYNPDSMYDASNPAPLEALDQ